MPTGAHPPSRCCLTLAAGHVVAMMTPPCVPPFFRLQEAGACQGDCAKQEGEAAQPCGTEAEVTAAAAACCQWEIGRQHGCGTLQCTLQAGQGLLWLNFQRCGRCRDDPETLKEQLKEVIALEQAGKMNPSLRCVKGAWAVSVLRRAITLYLLLYTASSCCASPARESLDKYPLPQSVAQAEEEGAAGSVRPGHQAEDGALLLDWQRTSALPSDALSCTAMLVTAAAATAGGKQLCGIVHALSALA